MLDIKFEPVQYFRCNGFIITNFLFQCVHLSLNDIFFACSTSHVRTNRPQEKECCKEPWQFALRSLGLLKSTFQRFQGLAASSHQKIQVGKKPLLAGYYISDWVSAFGVVLKGNEFI